MPLAEGKAMLTALSVTMISLIIKSAAKNRLEGRAPVTDLKDLPEYAEFQEGANILVGALAAGKIKLADIESLARKIYQMIQVFDPDGVDTSSWTIKPPGGLPS